MSGFIESEERWVIGGRGIESIGVATGSGDMSTVTCRGIMSGASGVGITSTYAGSCILHPISFD